MKKYDLEERLVAFACEIIRIGEKLPPTYAAGHLSKQLIRSGTAVALNYGEAQGAESRADFIHKFKVAAKELRETFMCLKIIKRMLYLPEELADPIIQETNELISIFVASLKTARQNQGR